MMQVEMNKDWDTECWDVEWCWFWK